MDFDSTFNYTNITNKLRKRIKNLQQQNIAYKKILINIQSLYDESTGYINIAMKLRNEIARINTSVDYNTDMINKYHSLLNEINNITLLNDYHKSIIYYFYTVLNVDKCDFMTRILFNIDKINTVITLNTSIISSASVLYNTIIISPQYLEILNELRQYF